MIIFNAYYDDEFIGEIRANDSTEAEAKALEQLKEGAHPDPNPALIRAIIAR